MSNNNMFESCFYFTHHQSFISVKDTLNSATASFLINQIIHENVINKLLLWSNYLIIELDSLSQRWALYSCPISWSQRTFGSGHRNWRVKRWWCLCLTTGLTDGPQHGRLSTSGCNRSSWKPRSIKPPCEPAGTPIPFGQLQHCVASSRLTNAHVW